MFRRPLPLLVSFALASVVLAGCSSAAEAEELDPMESPLAVYMESVYSGQDEVDWEKQQMEVEELVAACMSGEGFEYIPVDQSQYTTFVEEDEDRDTEEWVASNGYGMSMSPEEIEQGNEEAENYVDPNQSYIEGLSESEQTAYYEVLYGSQDDAEMSEDGSYEYNWETAGCQGAAQHEIQGDDPYSEDEHKPLIDAMTTMYDDVMSNPTVAKLDAEWAACMADAGYPDFTTKQDAMNFVNDESNALYENLEEAGPTDEQLAAVRETEIEVALADFRCAEETDYTNKTLEVQFEIEEQFVADHKAELDALLADIDSSNG
ncbi:MAG TPA: hypothetical protein VGP24_05705 [Glaciihabitans sp.]|jgi:hypothetical protein|nr:hypothetical protein [Glaciihabitans sp.]